MLILLHNDVDYTLLPYHSFTLCILLQFLRLLVCMNMEKIGRQLTQIQIGQYL